MLKQIVIITLSIIITFEQKSPRSLVPGVGIFASFDVPYPDMI